MENKQTNQAILFLLSLVSGSASVRQCFLSYVTDQNTRVDSFSQYIVPDDVNNVILCIFSPRNCDELELGCMLTFKLSLLCL